MERAPKIVKDKETADIFDHVFRNALGNIVVLPAAPTAKDDLKPNSLGYYNNELFMRLANGELKKFTLTDIP